MNLFLLFYIETPYMIFIIFPHFDRNCDFDLQHFLYLFNRTIGFCILRITIMTFEIFRFSQKLIWNMFIFEHIKMIFSKTTTGIELVENVMASIYVFSYGLGLNKSKINDIPQNKSSSKRNVRAKKRKRWIGIINLSYNRKKSAD